jgi:glycosyltransferase involved in cell wall biosynthesis
VEFELVLAGDGPLRAQLEALIGTRQLAERVRITGWISSAEVREQLLAARALVLPSFAEGLPVVIMEAMSLRRPVISTYIAGIPELVRDGENGWLIPAGSIDDLASAMQDCLSRSAAEMARLGAAAYERVISRHDIDVEARKLANLFAEATAAATAQ